jgi:signal transduction histidine kinase
MDIKGIFRRRSRLFITITGFVLVIIIGIIDYLSGPVYSSLIAYLIPVIFVTRLAGRTAGLTMSAVSSAVWIFADILSNPDHTFLMVHFWNLLEKLSVFLIIVFILVKLAKMEEERKNMLSMLAHDMKNPTLVAKGFSTRLLRGKAGRLTESQADYVGLIDDELSRLERLLLDFLDMSKIGSKEFKPRPVQLDIAQSIKNHVGAVGIEADKKKITVSLEFPPEGIPPVFADTVLIDRVIRNLVGNAIKYTDPGGAVTVKLSEKNRYVIVRVKDTGRGIPEEHIQHIFKPFYRVARDAHGIGLGLPVVQSIIKAHGGEIWVESVPGKGSTFTFTLPKFRAGRHHI